MGLIPWGSWGDVDHVRREMGNFLENSPLGFLSRGGTPRIDVYQTEEDVIVKAEIPGVAKEDLQVFLDENSLRLAGQTKRDGRYKDENMYRTERFFGSFSRTVSLPVSVKSDKAKAEYKEGILSITVPKEEPAKLKGRRIDIH